MCFLILSRPEAHIHEAFDEPEVKVRMQVLPLYEDYRARRDVESYLRAEFGRIRESPKHRTIMSSVHGAWPSNGIMKQLLDKAGGYFIYAATIIRFIDESDYSTCVELLDQVLQPNSASDDSPFGELDKLYVQILLAYSRKHRPLLKLILGFLFLNRQLCSPQGIDVILALPDGKAAMMLRGLRSLVHVTEDGYCQLYHASFEDFLRDPDRSEDFYIDMDAWCEEVSGRIFAALHPDTVMADRNRAERYFQFHHICIGYSKFSSIGTVISCRLVSISSILVKSGPGTARRYWKPGI
jgi:hypothetical protein